MRLQLFGRADANNLQREGGVFIGSAGEVKERGREVPIPNGEDLNESVRRLKRVTVSAEVEEAWMVPVMVFCVVFLNLKTGYFIALVCVFN
jgi:hypothetical protein